MPGLGGEAGVAHCGSSVLEVEGGGERFHQEPPPAVAQLVVETVGALLTYIAISALLCHKDLEAPKAHY